jgi:hypothetical protein
MDPSCSHFMSAGIITAMEALAETLGLPPDFLVALLLEDDDWSFVVKCHALMESAVCALLATHLKAPELEGVLAERVDMSARIEMLSAMGLLTKPQRGMIRALGTLRSKLVHNAAQTRFTFAEYFQSPEVAAQFGRTFGAAWPDPVPAGASVPRAAYVMGVAKCAMLADVLAMVNVAAGKRAAEALARFDKLVRQLAADVDPVRRDVLQPEHAV